MFKKEFDQNSNLGSPKAASERPSYNIRLRSKSCRPKNFHIDRLLTGSQLL